ncbi:MAG: tannase/feruloyl esterase family alpha/beta hydrolase [Deltaproteobacteria bacterium]|nr:tannase/feruloyl esterase family alpha/beta hydrolase [Deltaproteobacteria bacterium]
MGGNKFFLDGDGKETGSTEIPGAFDQFSLLQDWVEKGKAPGKSVIATGRSDSSKTMPLCPYPAYPKYLSGGPSKASSYTCADPW